MSAIFNTLGITVWDMLIYLINIVILFFILRWLLYKPVTKFLEKRQQGYADKVAEIEQREADTAVLREKYESLLSDAQSQAADIINKGNEMAQERSKTIIEDAKEQARILAIRTHEDIQTEKKIAKQEMKEEIVEMAIQIAGRVLEREVTEKDNKKIINEFFDKTAQTGG